MYQALYRKYRPLSFDDVISQPHITETLKNQIITGKTAHAYLFTGSRGTGKTTCARIFAKAVNCLNPINGNPCGECEICRDADNSALSDIIEIDAASNGSVNDARELREAAEYTPERCAYKVYIIDEVHMLSKDAFNALLKIIEEPPPHIKFIMATTELHKVLPTILSRCQRFDFMRIKTEDIALRLEDIAKKENITLEKDAAELIAKAADGGMRDALSVMDRCIAFSETITADTVSEAAGISGGDQLLAIAEAVADRDAAKALDIIDKLYSRSKDMQRLCEELSGQMRNVMIAVSAPDRTNVIVCMPGELDIIKRIGEKMGLDRVLGCLDALAGCAERMTRSLSKRTDIEMCVIRMCSGKASSAVSAETAEEIRRLSAKIAALEDRLRDISAAPRSGGNPRPSREPVMDISAAKGGEEPVFIEKWADIAEALPPALVPVLRGTYGYAKGNILLINDRNKLSKALLNSKENVDKVLGAVRSIADISLAKILVGYNAALDRSASDVPRQTDEASSSGERQDALKLLLDKARSGGVEIDTV